MIWLGHDAKESAIIVAILLYEFIGPVREMTIWPTAPEWKDHYRRLGDDR